jgi:hypothetical protein
MSSQNLVSATLSPEDATEVHRMLDAVRTRLPFLITLKPGQVRGIAKSANRFRPFVDKAHAVARSQPDILPKVFDAQEYHQDWSLVQELTPILAKVEQLAQTLRDTLLAANSDAHVQSLEVYAAVKQNADRLPGLSVVADEMAVFFQRPRRKAA